MENQELFELRKHRTLTFTSPKLLADTLSSLMVEEVKFPLVVGYERFDPKTDWSVAILSPMSMPDELTVRNYMEGLREVCTELASPDFLVFSGFLVYNGVEAMDKNHQNELVFGAQFGVGHPKQTAGDYSLSRSFGLDLCNDGKTYYARTGVNRPRLDEIMERFMGPN